MPFYPHPYFLNLTNIKAKNIALASAFSNLILEFYFYLFCSIFCRRWDMIYQAALLIFWVIMVGWGLFVSCRQDAYARRSFASCFYRVIHELGALCCNVAFFACLIRLLSAFNLILSGSNLTALRSNSNPYFKLVI